MSKIKLRAAVESDSDAILKFLRYSYYPEEPLTRALEPFQQADEDEQFNLSCIKHGTCVIAYYSDDADDTAATSTSIQIVNNSSTTSGNNNDDNSVKMNFLNHEARNQHNRKFDCKCNSKYQCNQYKHEEQQCGSGIENDKLNKIVDVNLQSKDSGCDSMAMEIHHQQQQQSNVINKNKTENENFVVKELLGALIAGPKYPGESEHLLDASNTVKSIKWSKMLKFLSYLELKANVFEYFNCQSAVHCHAMAVDQNARGKSIGIKMLKEFIKICKKLQYPVVTLDCTSIYSIRLCEKLNMICLNEMKFADYHNEKGELVFRPPSPHKLIKTFAKKIDNDIDDDC